MLTGNCDVTSGTVKMVLCALVVLGLCSSVISATVNVGFMDYLQQGKLNWVKKNPHHPKWIQMLNMVNLKTESKNALYGVQSVRAAQNKEGTYYDATFWPITDKKELPTCNTQFFIPLFGRHRDMTIKSYSCEPLTRNQDTIADRTHLIFKGKNRLLTLEKLPKKDDE
uniref:Alanine--tRNA ligase n=1 Tax=Lygus hesperus TaxID=30085 RepID=A0A0A9WIC7_LYGHE